jgi:hypothetical protein
MLGWLDLNCNGLACKTICAANDVGVYSIIEIFFLAAMCPDFWILP